MISQTKPQHKMPNIVGDKVIFQRRLPSGLIPAYDAETVRRHFAEFAVGLGVKLYRMLLLDRWKDGSVSSPLFQRPPPDFLELVKPGLN